MFHHDILKELLPAFHHVGGLLLGVVGKEFGVLVGMGLPGGNGQLLNHLALLDNGLLQRVAHLLQVGEYL